MVRIVYEYNERHNEWLFHWQILTEIETKRFGLFKRVEEEWITYTIYDTFSVAQKAMEDYISDVRH